MKQSTLTAEQHAVMLPLLGSKMSHADLARKIGTTDGTIRYWRTRLKADRMDGCASLEELAATTADSETIARRLGIPTQEVVDYRAAKRAERRRVATKTRELRAQKIAGRLEGFADEFAVILSRQMMRVAA
jgi:hypothetical protein